MPHLLVFGYGYSARRVGALLRSGGLDRGERASARSSSVPSDSWRITGTRRSSAGVAETRAIGIEGALFDGVHPSEEVAEALVDVTHLLVTAAPDGEGDAVLRHYSEAIRSCRHLGWVGYLSTVGVYGDHGGGWVDESTPPVPTLPRTRRRVEAERAWTALCEEIDVPLQIFRLPGIYGPGRSVVERLRSGTARRIVKDGQLFNRIHVDDLAGVVVAGMCHPDEHGVFNVADDLPTAPDDPLLYAAAALGYPPPPPVPIEDAGLGPMGLSFFSQCRRVRNDRMKKVLGYRLLHPTYREGIDAILALGA